MDSGPRQETPIVIDVDSAEGRVPQEDGEGDRSPATTETVEQPAKVMRIGSMIKQLLDEVRNAPLDEAGRDRLREIYDTSMAELKAGLSPDLTAELDRMTIPFGPDTPSEAELRVAQAQLVGWLEGLFQGIQATLFAQQMAARAQLDEMRRRGLPVPGQPGTEPPRPGTYL
ncbi:MAG TPA: bacterial proteasome activator family protein [Acidimicrobiales bacterium]|nr:bacterial proteasome activator family protein [Acidimicrobiales bacterium]